MARIGKALAVALTLTGALVLVGASSSSSAAPAPASPAVRSPTALPGRAPVAGVDAGTTTPPATSAVATLSAAQKATVLKQKNDLRAALGASTTQTLGWDDNLALFASRVA